MIIAPNTMRRFTFAGIDSSTYFLTTSIERSILPPIDVTSITVPQRAGAYPVRSELGVRTITIGVQLVENTWEDLRTQVRKIAQWLYRDEETELILSDEPDKYYLARLQGDTALSELMQMGETTLTFICHDPYAYALEETDRLFQDLTGFTFVNNGTVETYPRFRVVVVGTSATNPRIQKGTRQVQVNGIFTQGDVIIIDHNINAVYMEADNRRIMDRVDLSSDFFEFHVGENRLTSPTDGISIRTFWRERYL